MTSAYLIFHFGFGMQSDAALGAAARVSGAAVVLLQVPRYLVEVRSIRAGKRRRR